MVVTADTACFVVYTIVSILFDADRQWQHSCQCMLLFSLVFAPWLMVNLRSIRLPHWSVLGLFVIVYVVALLCWPQYGLSKSILHWLFGLYLITIVINTGTNFSREAWLKLLETGACIFLVMHVLFLIMNHATVTWLLQGYYTGELMGTNAAKLPSLTRGGRNLDATWLALGGFFVTGKKKRCMLRIAFFLLSWGALVSD